ncbi:MAG TPA: carboxypeptidase-like regulatory domain-containing protein [Nevskia sp.]|nr:carboxypeptidase-like regulatory domain-containing protein [Nevskia sp.]
MKTWIPLSIGSVAVALALGCPPASADSGTPVAAGGGISYVSGGIGLDESGQMKMEARRYPLALEFLEQTHGVGTYSAGEQVMIQDAGGRAVFSATSQGPFMLIDLPDGRYSVTASCNGREQTREIEVLGGAHRQISFVWPAKPDEHLAGGGRGEIDLSNQPAGDLNLSSR